MIHGIDISSAQRNLNITKVSTSFVIIKATGGNNYVNPYCNRHYNECIASKKLIGLYHYAHEYKKNHTANHEADYFIKNIKNYIGKAMLVLDYEEPLNHKYFTSKDVNWINKFIRRVNKKTKVTPVIYVSKSFVQSHNFASTVKLNAGLWFAQYANYQPMKPTRNPWTDKLGTGAFKNPIMFQYTSNGRLKGYNGALDLDNFYGDSKAWKAYAKGNR